VVIVVVGGAVELLSHLNGLTSYRDRRHPVDSLVVLHIRVNDGLTHVKLSSHHRCSCWVVHARRTRGHLVHHTGHINVWRIDFVVVLEVRRLILRHSLSAHLKQ
jgi:hypothetical protein